MYPPREPNVYRDAGQFPGDDGDVTPRRIAITFKTTGRSHLGPSIQNGADIAISPARRLTGTLAAKPPTAANDQGTNPKRA